MKTKLPLRIAIAMSLFFLTAVNLSAQNLFAPNTSITSSPYRAGLNLNSSVGFRFVLNNTTTSHWRNELTFMRGGAYGWAIGSDLSMNNTNDFYIFGGSTRSTKFHIDIHGKIGINGVAGNDLLTLNGGDLRIIEPASYPSATAPDGNGADLILQDNQGGTLNLFSSAKQGWINLGGGSEELRICNWGGKIVMGNVTTPGNYKLYVQSGILTERLKLAVSSDVVNWADFVFAKEYKLRPLSEVEDFVKANKHLPEIPSAEEVYTNGIDVAQMDAKLLQKIEELTLYIIELEKKNKELTERMEQVEKKSKKE